MEPQTQKIELKPGEQQDFYKIDVSEKYSSNGRFLDAFSEAKTTNIQSNIMFEICNIVSPETSQSESDSSSFTVNINSSSSMFSVSGGDVCVCVMMKHRYYSTRHTYWKDRHPRTKSKFQYQIE